MRWTRMMTVGSAHAEREGEKERGSMPTSSANASSLPTAGLDGTLTAAAAAAAATAAATAGIAWPSAGVISAVERARARRAGLVGRVGADEQQREQQRRNEGVPSEACTPLPGW